MKKILLLTALATGLAQAGQIDLIQTGWDSGGPLLVSFAGEDIDLDGYITVPELTSFSASFATYGGGSWDWSLPDLDTDGFAFKSLTDYYIKADGAVGSLYSIAIDGSYLSYATAMDYTVFTDQPFQSVHAPEPGSAAMLGLGLFGAAVVMGKRWVTPRAALEANSARQARPALPRQS